MGAGDLILWTFLFTDRQIFRDKKPYESARVAAPNRDIAYMMMGRKVGVPIVGEQSVICASAGMVQGDSVKVISMKTLEGEIEAY